MFFGTTTTTMLIIPNKEMEDILKIVKYLEYSSLLIKSVIQTIKNRTKEQREGFLGMLLDTLGASLLGSILSGKRCDNMSFRKRAEEDAELTYIDEE